MSWRWWWLDYCCCFIMVSTVNCLIIIDALSNFRYTCIVQQYEVGDMRMWDEEKIYLTMDNSTTQKTQHHLITYRPPTYLHVHLHLLQTTSSMVGEHHQHPTAIVTWACNTLLVMMLGRHHACLHLLDLSWCNNQGHDLFDRLWSGLLHGHCLFSEFNAPYSFKISLL